MTDRLRPSEVAARLGASTRTVQRWIASGRLPAARLGGRLYVASDAFDAFVREIAPPRPETVRSPIRTLFVANRGEIARRIVRTADRLGIRAVVPSTERAGAIDLLDPVAVVAAATAAGADALHPGYGFLSEHGGFAEAVTAAGLRWVGPPASAIRQMGDKAAARRLAARLGVPVVPGYDGPDQRDATLRRVARRIGFPVLVKPAGGGGGKGMQVVREPAALGEALAAARRTAGAAFGDDRLILERFVEGPRHIEIQVLFDAAGTGVHLGERDCSAQRRHQKILEETPSPAVAPALRARLGAWALRLAAAVGYVSAGTCEFLVTDDGEAWFLEMNTRLQVEHPVTEAVTGRDLVADQLAIAAGRSLADLGLEQAAVDAALTAGGHAIEVRLYAEDAEAGFLPATGPVVALRWPAGDGIRIDAGIEHGAVIDERFDPLLAKLVAHGPDRTIALERLTDALERTVLLGPVTNLRFLRWLVRRPEVRAGEVRIDTLERIWPPSPIAAEPATGTPDLAWAAAAAAFAAADGTDRADDPWSGGWRLNGPPRLRLMADGRTRTATPSATGTGPQAVVVDGVAHVDVDGRSVAFRLAPPPDVDRSARAALAHRAAGRSTVTAPMPGSVITVHVAVGDEVAAGDPIVTLGAMKMEHVVAAPGSGRLAEVEVRAGDQVTRDQPLATIDA